QDRAETLETTYAPRLTTAEQDIQENYQELTSHMAESVNQVSGVHGLKIESGTFIPKLFVGENEVTGTTVKSGYYKVIDDLCFFRIEIVLGVICGIGAGELSIRGLPFAANNNRAMGRVSILISFIRNMGLPEGYNQHVVRFVEG